jgi:hypothetical protein
MDRIHDIGTVRVNDRIGKCLKGFETLPLPLLIEHFGEAVLGDPERQEAANLLLDALRKYIDRYGKKHKVNAGALYLAVMVFAQNICAHAAITAAETEEEERPAT